MFRATLDRLRSFRQRLTPRLAWDLFMVYLATLNLGLIFFDLTYLWLRPQYHRFLPAVTAFYDPIKGIQAHPLTEQFLEITDELTAELEVGATDAELEPLLAELRPVSVKLLERNPFERTGQMSTFIRLQGGAKARLLSEGKQLPSDLTAAQGAELFWTFDPEHFRTRLAYFNSELRPLLAVSYDRGYDLDGELIDHFWLIDLPFLTLFAWEFALRWFLAWRRQTYRKWFLFPIFNWYDLLGIVPLKGFRFFRLFRIASIYVRLHRSELTSVGDDFVSRTVRYFANIISEEISDMVALRILNETQEEIRDGTHKRIILSVVERHRDGLTTELTSRLRDIITDETLRTQARELLDVNLEQAVESAEALRRIPLPNSLLRPLVSSVGEAVFDSFADTLTDTLDGDEGRVALEALVAHAIDDLVEELTEGELENLVREIALLVIDHMKEAVAVRKWALPDQPSRGVFTWAQRD